MDVEKQEERSTQGTFELTAWRHDLVIVQGHTSAVEDHGNLPLADPVEFSRKLALQELDLYLKKTVRRLLGDERAGANRFA